MIPAIDMLVNALATHPDFARLDSSAWSFRTVSVWLCSGQPRSVGGASPAVRILLFVFNVHPTEIEQIANPWPSVLECAAVGIPDERSG